MIENVLLIILWLGIAILVFLPPKYDPAIRLKERNERMRRGKK